ncbi:STAS domain-containing protein [Acinetobacter apis]|uniref:Phospholipid transport system transporter-binding protein n=1 Tax=Acinetobacter apis TaxID=1229165 RepID=A0A217EGM2_9GAMM|nr:STAS domain-containing protein [Acinetobacter apis]SNQ29350.1 phospholipid transport system transporter-binding protein [Acinetobacter apis]
MELYVKDQQLMLVGQIDFNNAEHVYQQGLKIIQSHPLPLVINGEALEHGSTLALAVFVQWVRHVPHTHDLVFKALTKKMLNILQASHLDHELTLSH